MKTISKFILTALFGAIISSCGSEEPAAPIVTAAFDVEVDEFTVTIKNRTEGAATYEWTFGDGQTSSQSGTEFTHTYSSAGTYSIVLVAKKGATSKTTFREAIVTGKVNLLKFLSNGSEKTWNMSSNTDEMIGMYNKALLPDTWQWWHGYVTFGGVNATQRNAARAEDYTFKADGTFVFKINGSSFRPADLFGSPDPINNGVFAATDPWTLVSGGDGAAFGNGTHRFEILSEGTFFPSIATAGGVKLVGLGAHIGPMDCGGLTAYIKTPAQNTYYDVIHYADGGQQPDTLKLLTNWGANAEKTAYAGAGVITLVSYKNTAQKPQPE